MISSNAKATVLAITVATQLAGAVAAYLSYPNEDVLRLRKMCCYERVIRVGG